MSSVRLEVDVPIAGAFILDTSELDGPDLLPIGTHEAKQWIDVKCDATVITVKRGGTRNGFTSKTEVGSLLVSFVDGVNPLDDPNLRPGVAVRLLEDSSDQLMFTGTIDGFGVTYDKRDDHSYITMQCFDAVVDLVGTHRVGVDGPEPWQERVSHLLESSAVPYVAPHGGEKWALVMADPGSENNGWSGDWLPAGGGHSWIWYTNPSAIASTRTLTGLIPGNTYRTDVWLGRDSGDASVLYCTLDTPVFDERIRTSFGGSMYQARYWFIAQTNTVTLTIGGPAGVGFGVSLCSLRELVPTFWAAPIVHESNLASHLDIATTSADVGWFVDTSGVVQISDTVTYPVMNLSDQHVEEDPMHVCYTDAVVSFDTAEMVNSLTFANHSRAYTGDPVNIIQPPAPASTFVGSYSWFWNPLAITTLPTLITFEVRLSHATAIDGRYPYVDEPFVAQAGRWVTVTGRIDAGVGSYVIIDFVRSNMIDPGVTVTLEVRNLQAQTITGVAADDTTIGPFAAMASAATWGPRPATLETAIYTGHQQVSDNHPAILAQRILDRYSVPEPTVSSVTLDALKHLDLAASVEIRDTVTVTHRAVSQTATVIGINHVITPKKWFTTLTLMEASN